MEKEITMMHDFTSLNKEINNTVPVEIMSSYIQSAKGALLNIVCKFDNVDADTMREITEIKATLSLLEKWVGSIECVDVNLFFDVDSIKETINDIEGMTKETVSRLRAQIAKLKE